MFASNTPRVLPALLIILALGAALFGLASVTGVHHPGLALAHQQVGAVHEPAAADTEGMDCSLMAVECVVVADAAPGAPLLDEHDPIEPRWQVPLLTVAAVENASPPTHFVLGILRR